MREAIEAAEAAETAQIRLDNAQDYFIEHNYDYKEAIAGTTFAEDYDLTKEEIDSIDIALNEYKSRQSKTTPAEIGRLRQASLSAAKLLNKANSQFVRMIKTLNDIEPNPYALSALFAALPKDKDQDEQIDELNRAIEATRILARILATANERYEPSNGLPVFAPGNPGNPNTVNFDRLISRLNGVVDRILKRNEEQDDAPRARRSVIAPGDAAEGIRELLTIVGYTYDTKTVRNRLGELGGLPFPLIG